MSIGLTQIEAFEVKLADRSALRTRRELKIDEVGYKIRAIDESNFRIEIRLNCGMLNGALYQVALVGRADGIGPILTAQLRIKRGCFCVEARQRQFFEEDEIPIKACG